jgi:hypothetical protein
MRASLSQVDNINDLSTTSDDEKSHRETHHRSQKAFSLNDAHTLKVIKRTFKNLIFL